MGHRQFILRGCMKKCSCLRGWRKCLTQALLKNTKRTAKSVMHVCQENNEIVRNYSKNESRSLVIC